MLHSIFTVVFSLQFHWWVMFHHSCRRPISQLINFWRSESRSDHENNPSPAPQEQSKPNLFSFEIPFIAPCLLVKSPSITMCFLFDLPSIITMDEIYPSIPSLLKSPYLITIAGEKSPSIHPSLPIHSNSAKSPSAARSPERRWRVSRRWEIGAPGTPRSSAARPRGAPSPSRPWNRRWKEGKHRGSMENMENIRKRPWKGWLNC